ncbi:MAG: hypothetical protein EHM70_10155 [Chloroflexota bacterium]|nr:MAG: hypothetical protein EHM70_10155 [Chloroflexota bacterium]
MPPLIFSNIWFLPKENTWKELNFLAYRDTGRLVVHPDRLEFQSSRQHFVLAPIRRVSIGKQGRDFVNNWVKVEYGDGDKLQAVWFADGSLLGWGGLFGGTQRLFNAIYPLAGATQAV